MARIWPASTERRDLATPDPGPPPGRLKPTPVPASCAVLVGTARRSRGRTRRSGLPCEGAGVPVVDAKGKRTDLIVVQSQVNL